MEKDKPVFTDQNKVEFWDRIYDQQDYQGENYRQRMDIALTWLDGLGLPRNSRILDVGCGAGKLLSEAASREYSVFGMDLSFGMLEAAKRNTKRERNLVSPLLQGNIESLPLKDSSFDAVFCLGVIAYLPSEEKALYELARVLKPGGVLVISTLNKARLVRYLDIPLLFMRVFRRMRKKITAAWKKSTSNGYQPGLVTFLVPRMRRSLRKVGLKVLEFKSIPYDRLTFWGSEHVYPPKLAAAITRFFEQQLKVPFVESFGGMCIFMANKDFSENTGSPLRNR